MSKKGVSVISGNISPIAGEKYTYHIVDWYKDTPISERNPKNVIWELFRKRKNGKFTTTNIKKKGDSNFTFGEASIGNTYRLEGYLHQPEGGGLVITPKQSSTPKINKVELFYVDDTKGSTFSFREKLIARAYCSNMFNKELVFTLWEDDAKGSGHNANNKAINTAKAKVNEKGVAVVEFTLTKALMQKSMQGETDPKQLEFYVTVEYYVNKKHATDNIEINNPFPQPPKPQPKQTPAKPKAKGSPAEQKPKSKKEEKGIGEKIAEAGKELWDWWEAKGTAKKDKTPTTQKPEGKSPAIVKEQKQEKKETCVCKEQYKDLVWGEKVSCEFRKKVVQMAINLGLPQKNYEGANWLMTIMALESAYSFSPKFGTFGKNPDESSKYKYVGLIQFGKAAAEEVGTTRTHLMSLTAEAQLDYVEKHF